MDDLISDARALLLSKLPYYRRLAFRVNYVEDAKVPTACMDHWGTLKYNPQFLAGLRNDQRAFVLLHEYTHFLRRHSKRMQNYNHTVANICLDLEINDDIAKCFPPSPGAMLPAVWKLPPNLLAEEYAKLLGAPKSPTGVCGGDCGGVAQPSKNPDTVPENGITQEEAQRITRSVAEAAKSVGTISTGMQRWIDEVLDPQVNWEDQLRQVVGAARVLARPGDYRTYTRINRRQAGLGFNEGTPRIATKFRQAPRVSVAVDLSGSMDNTLLVRVFSELRGVFEACGDSLEFLAFDSEITGVGTVKDLHEAAALCRGGGGTDFRPVFRHIAEAEDPPDLFIMMTDGYGPAPKHPPTNTEVVWLIVPGGKCPAPWGTAIEVK